MSAARKKAPAAAQEAIPFRTTHEEGFLVEADAVPPALIINPAATLESVLAAVQSRVGRLDASLDSWACADLEVGAVGEVAYPLRRFAEESKLLLDHARRLLAHAGRPS